MLSLLSKDHGGMKSKGAKREPVRLVGRSERRITLMAPLSKKGMGSESKGGGKGREKAEVFS